MFNLECVKVAFFLDNAERFYRVNVLFTIRSCISSYQFKPYSIIQAFFIDYVSNSIFFSAFDITGFQIFQLVARYDFDRIPLGNDFFFPCSNFFCFCIVISRQHMETFCQLIVELIVVVVQLAFHRIVRSDLSDRILHYLDPAFGVSLLVTSVV